MRRVLNILRWIIISIIGLVIAIPILLGVIAKYVGPGSSTTPPSAANAPWLIQTTSRIYYGAEFSIVKGTPELKNYWVLDGNNYKYKKGIIAFPENLYGSLGKTVILVQRISGVKK